MPPFEEKSRCSSRLLGSVACASFLPECQSKTVLGFPRQGRPARPRLADSIRALLWLIGGTALRSWSRCCSRCSTPDAGDVRYPHGDRYGHRAAVPGGWHGIARPGEGTHSSAPGGVFPPVRTRERAPVDGDQMYSAPGGESAAVVTNTILAPPPKEVPAPPPPPSLRCST